MAGVILSSLDSVLDHVTAQIDLVVDLLKNGDNAEATRLFKLSIHPYLGDLDSSGRIEYKACRAMFLPSSDLERARKIIKIAEHYFLGYKCRVNLNPEPEPLREEPEEPIVIQIPKLVLPALPENKSQPAAFVAVSKNAALPRPKENLMTSDEIVEVDDEVAAIMGNLDKELEMARLLATTYN